jgi:hypothetical protein
MAGLFKKVIELLLKKPGYLFFLSGIWDTYKPGFFF